MNELARQIETLVSQLKEAGFRGSVARDVPVREYTSYRIGGPARLLVEVPGSEDLRLLKTVLNSLNVPAMVLGGGSNVLISDQGFHGAVIRLGGDFAKLACSGNSIQAGAAVPTTTIVQEGVSMGLREIVRLAGIPGWLGGAVVMNAGTYGEYMDGLLQSVEVFTADGRTLTLQASECSFAYRSSRFQDSGEIVLGAVLKGTITQSKALKEEVERRLEVRKRTQPVDVPSCGSVFKNPPGERSAARLIEDAGLKGTRRGGAVISSKHANFIVNDSGATAQDVIELMALARHTVRKLYGITLVPEVRAYGFEEDLEVMLDRLSS